MPQPAEVIARQIRAGAFDGMPHAPASLPALLADTPADSSERHQLEDALRFHVGTHLRSADPRRIDLGLTHLEIAARAGAPVAITLVIDARESLADSVWTTWAARDPETAERFRSEVETVADQAAQRIASGTCGAR
jgi:hypothetical protein